MMLNTKNQSTFDILSAIQFVPGDLLILGLDQTLWSVTKTKEGIEQPLLTHPKLPALLDRLQTQGIIILVITSRSFELADKTIEQLASFELKFSLASQLLSNDTIHSKYFIYKEGLLFSTAKYFSQYKKNLGHIAKSLVNALQNLEETVLERCGLKKKVLTRHVFLVGDQTQVLKNIMYGLKSSSLAAIKTKYLSKRANIVPLLISNSLNNTQFPSSLNSLKYVEHLGGGSGGVYRLIAPNGAEFTFKAHEDINHLQEEIIADSLYQSAGCAVPDFAIVTEIPNCLAKKKLPLNGIYRLAQFIPGDKKPDKQLVAGLLAKHFLLDVLLANWDITVDNFSNVILHHGTIYRIDNGGSLRYRATKGLKKELDNWSAYYAEELISLRNSQINYSAASVYQSLSSIQLQAQHKELVEIAPVLFSTLDRMEKVLNINKIHELRYFLSSRLYDIEIRLQAKSYGQVFESLKADPKHTSASVLIKADFQNTACILLGKKIKHEWYSDFGGRSERHDKNLAGTASREAIEESANILNFSSSYLEHCPSHDLINNQGQQSHTHRLFFAEHKFIDVKKLIEEVEQERYFTQEFIQFEWVPIKDLLKALQKQKYIEEEEEKTLLVSFTSIEDGQVKKLILFPPLAKILQQQPVLDHLQNWEYYLPLNFKRTRAHQQATNNMMAPEYLTWDKTSQKNFFPIRVSHYENFALKEIRYPDPKAEHHAKIKTIIASSQIHQELKLRAQKKLKANFQVKRSQTVAFLQGYLGTKEQDLKQLLKDFFSFHPEHNMASDFSFQAMLQEIVEAETSIPNHVVLYHATNSKIGFFLDIITALRSLLTSKNDRSMRAFDDIFEGLDDVEMFLIEHCQKQNIVKRILINDERNNYAEKGISCNFSLFGSYDEYGECSVKFFYNNYNISNRSLSSLRSGLNMLLERLSIRSVFINDFINLFKNFKQDNGYLYQIFIHENFVDKLSYFSRSFGAYHETPWKPDMRVEDQHKLLPVLNELRNDPETFFNYPGIKNQELQARLFMQPHYMHDPKIVTIKKYTKHEMPDSYFKELNTLVHRVAHEIIRKRHDLSKLFKGSLRQHPTLFALQKKYSYFVLHDEQRKLNFKAINTKPLLYRHKSNSGNDSDNSINNNFRSNQEFDNAIERQSNIENQHSYDRQTQSRNSNLFLSVISQKKIHSLEIDNNEEPLTKRPRLL